ncbi:unnamed protein product [Leuciscus chuanchicus]
MERKGSSWWRWGGWRGRDHPGGGGGDDGGEGIILVVVLVVVGRMEGKGSSWWWWWWWGGWRVRDHPGGGGEDGGEEIILVVVVVVVGRMEGNEGVSICEFRRSTDTGSLPTDLIRVSGLIVSARACRSYPTHVYLSVPDPRSQAGDERQINRNTHLRLSLLIPDQFWAFMTLADC